MTIYSDGIYNVFCPVANHLCARLAHFLLFFTDARNFHAIFIANTLAAHEYSCYAGRQDFFLIYGDLVGGYIFNFKGDFFLLYFDFFDDFEAFQSGMQTSIKSMRSGGGEFDPKDERDDLIHFTSIPWLEFTAIRHPRRPIPGDSVPKIAFGKCHEDRGRFVVPMAIDAHHALVDGLHVAQFLEKFERYTAKT